MTPSRSYLIRAMYEWIVDNRMTPHILAHTDHNEVQVPGEFVEDGMITLNIGPTAVQSLDLGQDAVRCDARFSGISASVEIPVECVCAIYARENGQGMRFAEDDDLPPATGPAKSDRPHLRVVK